MGDRRPTAAERRAADAVERARVLAAADEVELPERCLYADPAFLARPRTILVRWAGPLPLESTTLPETP